jgi:hypothetical protein
MKTIWVSSALAEVPMPVAALRITPAAITSAAASLPPSTIDPFEIRVMNASLRTDPTVIESGDEAGLPRKPTLTLAVPNGSSVLMTRFTPAVLTDRFTASAGWVMVKMTVPAALRITETPLPRTPSSSMV